MVNNFGGLDTITIDAKCANMLGHDYSIKHNILPVKQENGRLWIATDTPDNVNILKDVADITGMFVVPVFAGAKDIRLHINRLLAPEAISSIASQFLVDARLDKQTEIHSPEILAEISSAPAVRLIDSIIESGIVNRASDIHIEPYDGKLRTRCRIDGHLSTYNHVSISLLPNVISRLKIMGGMDISERRRPQDGRFTMTFAGETIEFRLSVLPTAFGEKAAIRLLYGSTGRIHKANLGFFPDDLERITQLFNIPHGAVFVTGPTGSGKSTTLNSFMAELNHEKANIITVEDPVENPIPGINHVNVERAAGFSFASALRHILRQDPDVIMIGEIRDEETAHIAMQAALTGHLVFSTLHTNDAVGVIERLLDMGVEPYLLAAALGGVVSQRLVRRICKECTAPAILTAKQATLLDICPTTAVFAGKGCKSCANTGYKGRIAVYEYIIVTNDMRRSMSTDPYAFAEKMRTHSSIRSNALRHVLAGNTTADEILLL